MRIGAVEIILIIVLALVLFGGAKIAGLGKSLGRSIKEFRNEIKADDTPVAAGTDATSVAAGTPAITAGTPAITAEVVAATPAPVATVADAARTKEEA